MIFSTLSLAGTAAYYSVFGLSSLFAGAKTEVIIMASALELAKLVVASYLHNHWSKLGWILKSYLTLGVGILMIITSAGIYGFLTSAYQTTADQLTIIDKQTKVVEMKRERFSESLDGYRIERTQLNSSITELTKGLSNNTIQYKDKETGEIITTTSSSTRRVLTSQLNDMKEQRNGVSVKMEALTDSITKLDLKVLDMESNNEVAAEIGPLRYMAEITNKPMATIVNWFTLMIVCVFDPLAIAMVLAVNKFIGRKEEDEVVVKKEPVIKHAYVENDERMNIIGQNGNDGEHYSEVEEMIKKNEEILATKKVEPKPKKKIYGGFSKPYSDGTAINEDDIKTY
tara:strand:- start:292 stop:1317 length:1026 start_codon:yes stop_codon:yes gene_type:complete